jgi:perosamine synthetase
MPCDLAALVPLARARGIPVIEDAACAVGSQVLWEGSWQPIGRPHGDLACFSFHPRKVLTTGDGGMIVTGRGDLDARMRMLRQHGMSVSDSVRYASPTVVFEEYPTVGYNYRMTDIQAAIGRVQLGRLPAIVARRRELGARYHARLADVPHVTPPTEPAWARSTWQSYAVRLRDVDQRAVMQRMLDDGIATRRAAMNAHREGAFPPGSWRSAGPLRHSEEIQDTAVVLPLFPDMSHDDQDLVIASLTRAVGR